MNIWLINHYYVPPSHAGGTRHHTLAKKLVERGHSVTIFASNYSHFNHQIIGDSFLENNKAEIIDGVSIIWIKTRCYAENGIGRLLGMFDFCRNFTHIASKILNLTGNPDLIIGSNPHLFAAYSGLNFAQKHKIKFYYEIRDLWPESLIDIKKISPIHPLIMYMAYAQKKLVKRSNRIITLLPYIKEYLKAKYKYNPANVIYIPNFVDVSLSTQSNTETEKSAMRFIYAGSHGPANGLNILLEAAEIIQNRKTDKLIEIMLIGDGSMKPKLLQMAKEKHLSNVIFCDPVPKKQIHEIIARADVGLMLLKESDVFKWGISPNKLFDYMILKKPTIFSVSSSNNPVDEYKAGITVKPDSPVALAEAMLEMTNLGKDKLMEMGENGYLYVNKFHNVEVLIDTLSNALCASDSETKIG